MRIYSLKIGGYFYIFVLHILHHIVAGTKIPCIDDQCVGSGEKLEKSAKNPNKTFNLPTLQHFIDTAFQNELQVFLKSGKQLKIGDAVLARMRGFQPWPGRVQSFTSNHKTINCFFFGTHNSGPVGSKNVIPFHYAPETVRLVCLKSPNNYIKGVKEIEIECGVPAELSCLNEFKIIK